MVCAFSWQELEANGASNEELDRMREVLQNEVERHAQASGQSMPWLSDVLTEQFQELLTSSSDDDK